MNESLEIKKISVLKFFIDNLEEYENYTPVKKEDIDLLLSTDSSYDAKNGIFSIILMLTYNTVIQNQLIDILKADIKFDFSIPKSSNFFTPLEKHKDKNDKKNYNVNNSFLNLILSICISTLRGIILEKCKGTFLENIYLPVVDVNKLRKNNKFKNHGDNIR